MAAQAGTSLLMEGIGLGESPRWHEGRLWFSDWIAHEVIALSESGEREVMAQVDALPFSIDWLPDGPMLITAGRELLRREADGSLVSHIDLGHLSEHGWNEIVVHPGGNVYVNNVDFDMMGGEEPKPGLIAVVTPDGASRKVADGLAFPNGMAITPDGATLIIAESYEGRLTAFDIEQTGDLVNRRVWADLGEGGDGICIDSDGAVWCPKFQSCVRVREGGEILETIELDRFCFACMLGGEDGGTLFLNVAEWNGPEGMFKEPRTGQVLTYEAPAPHAGYP